MSEPACVRVYVCVCMCVHPNTSSISRKDHRSRVYQQKGHDSVEDTKLSTNKQHTLSIIDRECGAAPACLAQGLAQEGLERVKGGGGSLIPVTRQRRTKVHARVPPMIAAVEVGASPPPAPRSPPPPASSPLATPMLAYWTTDAGGRPTRTSSLFNSAIGGLERSPSALLLSHTL